MGNKISESLKKFFKTKKGIENRKKLSERQKLNKFIKGEKSNWWKGDKVGYGGLHCYIKKMFGKPIKCDYCGIKNKNVIYKKNNKLEKRSKIQWANKSGKYLRNRNDWLQLCPKCHAKYDKRWLKRNRNKKGQFI